MNAPKDEDDLFQLDLAHRFPYQFHQAEERAWHLWDP
jgi:hypothetical protein